MDDVVSTQNTGTDRILKHRPYGIDTRDAIRSALAGYVGGINIIGELVQNADDAEAEKIQFYFNPDALVVKNSSYFRDPDFDNILAIASGGKRDQVGRIGTWGTGFLSVYHLTDSPELHSAGQQIRFDPSQHTVPVMESQVGKETVFIFPWRRQQTELGHRIEARVWSDANIQGLLEEIGTAIYRQLLFLRCVNNIEVYVGNGHAGQEKLLYRIAKRRISEDQKVGFVRERWEIEYQRAGNAARMDTWLYYRGGVPETFAVQDVTIKDRRIAIAFPTKSTEWLEKNVPGTLYNFLPTPIHTGYGFQINGAFFPDSSRRTILVEDSTQPEKSRWNRGVLLSLGNLIASKEVILDIRDQVMDARRFYELLPLGRPESEHSYLQPIQSAFAKAAPELPITYSSLGTWSLPRQVYIPYGTAGARLRELAQSHMPILPTETATKPVMEFLNGLPDRCLLTWSAVVEYLRPHLGDGKRLSATHSMINSREKLHLLYSALPQFSLMDAAQIASLQQTCLCLANDETVWTFASGQVWRAGEDTRKLLESTDIRFVDAKVQTTFPDLIRWLVPEFDGAHLVDWLADQDWPEGDFDIKEAPHFILGKDHLADMLKFIAPELKRTRTVELEWLPIVLTEANTLVSSDGAYLHNDPRDRAFLTQLGLDFVHSEWAADEEIALVYKKAGVAALEPKHVIVALRKQLGTWHILAYEEQVSRLLTLYDYFSRQAHQLNESEISALRQLQLFMDQKGRLVPAERDDVLMYLSPVGGVAVGQTVANFDDQQSQFLIHSDLQTPDSRRFLTSILGLSIFSSDALIEQVILPNYSALQDPAKQEALFYISEHLRKLTDTQSEGLLSKLREKDLVRCEDGTYKKGRQVYFASPALDAVFGSHYAKFHHAYGVQVPEADDADQTPYRRNSWYSFFIGLRANELPAPTDLVAAVTRQVASGPPTEESVDAVRRIYDLLNVEVGRNPLYTRSATLAHLASLRWLPAREDSSRWYLPEEVYPSRLLNLIGKQAPILRFNEASTELRKLLPTPVTVPPTTVAEHLLALAAEKQAIPIGIYGYLGDGWDNIKPATQHILKETPVVWDGKSKHWLGRHVLLGDYHSLYGSRRCYLTAKLSESASRFLEMLGAKEQPEGWRDQITLLREIAQAYSEGSPLSASDRDLLLANFDSLGRLANGSGLEQSAAMLQKFAVVPDRTGMLHHCHNIVLADREDYLDKFNTESVSVVAGSTTDSDISLSDAAFRYLLRMGVPRLSQSVRRRLSNLQGRKEDEILGLHLRALRDALLRVAVSVHEQKGTSVNTQKIRDTLGSIKLFVCSELTVEYILEEPKPSDRKVPGHKLREQALYDERTHSLYIVAERFDKVPQLPLAQELIRMLDLSRESVSLIERMLELTPSAVNDFLTERGYAKTYSDALTISSESDSSAGMAEWDSSEESAYLIAETSESIVLKQATTNPFERVVEHETLGKITHQATPVPAQVGEVGKIGETVSPPINRDRGIGQPLPVPENAGMPEPAYEKSSTADNAESDLSLANIPDKTTDAEYAPAQGEVDRNLGTNGTYEQAQNELDDAESSEIADSKPDIKPDLPSWYADGTDEIPAFTGQMRPAVPVRPNNYARLRSTFGLTRRGTNDALQDETYCPNDQLQEYSPHGRQEDYRRNGSRVEEVRFILKFTNKYEGFLPLNSQAQRMLSGRPHRLRCQVEYGGEEFDLYVDYELGVIYNQKALPALFSLHNIPAGGIVNLKLVHSDVVRLYWNRELNTVKQVLCLEIGEDGTVQEFLIDAAEYPCEVAEFVLRAEKRFEDLEALFMEALDKDGIFETICDVFGAPNRELTWDQIFRAVLATRKVATASIHFQLYQRPCFVQVNANTWRFEPHRGYDPSRPKLPSRPPSTESSEKESTAYKNEFARTAPLRTDVDYVTSDKNPEVIAVKEAEDAEEVGVAVHRQRISQGISADDPYRAILEQVLNDWPAMEKWVTQDRGSTREQLAQMASHLERLVNQIRAGIAAISTVQRETDRSLLFLWQQLSVQPQDEQMQKALVSYLGSIEPKDSQELLLTDLRGLLLQSQPAERKYTYWPILSMCAEHARNLGNTAWAKSLYELLVEQGAGDFSNQLKLLGEFSRVEDYLEIIQQAGTLEERWAWIHEAWNECPDAPKLRALIQDALKGGIRATAPKVEQLIQNSKLAEALEEYKRCVVPLLKVSDAWSTSPQAFQLWELTGKLVDKLMAQETASAKVPAAPRTTLVLVAQLPAEAHKFIPAARYLRAGIKMARQFERQGSVVSAAFLLEYALTFFGKGVHNNQAEIAEAHEYASRLYQQLEAYGRAYSHLSVAHTLEVSRKVPYEQTKKLGWRCTTLRTERDKRDSAAEYQTWLGWATTLVQTSALGGLINKQLFTLLTAE